MLLTFNSTMEVFIESHNMQCSLKTGPNRYKDFVEHTTKFDGEGKVDALIGTHSIAIQ